jgi:hypothetical protein
VWMCVRVWVRVCVGVGVGESVGESVWGVQEQDMVWHTRVEAS